jgi:hypothetical protein
MTLSVLHFRIALVFFLLLLALVILSIVLMSVSGHMLPVQPSHGPLAGTHWD